MELSPEERKRIEEEEKVRIAAQQKAKQEADAKNLKYGGVGCLIIIVISLLFGLFMGLRKRSDVKPLFYVTELANKSAAIIDSAIGKPTSITPITSYPEQMPGEYREYTLSDGSTLQVKFYKGEAVVFTAWLKHPSVLPIQAPRYLGISIEDIMPLPIIQKGPAGRTWSGNINGVEFKEISSACQTSDTGKWDFVQAIVAGAP